MRVEGGICLNFVVIFANTYILSLLKLGKSMILRLMRWLSERWRQERATQTGTEAERAAEMEAMEQNARRVDRDVEWLRGRVALSRADCRALGEALHEGGLEAFAQVLPAIAQQYGVSITAQEFKAHLRRQQWLHQKRPAAYLVQFCRGGGLH